jgi:DNA-binding NarL/FixJ family response regulator
MLSRTCARCGNPFQALAREWSCPSCRDQTRVSKPLAEDLPTFREQQIIARIQEAKSNKQIAYELYLSEGTVKEYLYRIFRKLHVSNRTELAIRNGNYGNGPAASSAAAK